VLGTEITPEMLVEARRECPPNLCQFTEESMNKSLARLRTRSTRVVRRIGRALMKVASRYAERTIISIAKIPHTLSDKETELLPVRYDYRATTGGKVKFFALLTGVDVCFRLHAMSVVDGKVGAGDLILACDLPSIKRGDVFEVDLVGRSISLNGSRREPTTVRPLSVRKFVSEFQQTTAGRRYSRLCSHYLPFDNKRIGRDYYFGDDYVDYPSQTSGESGLALLRRFAACGRLLDIGCALGIFTKTFLDGGFDVYATDISEFAIGQAILLVGPERAKLANLDVDNIPFEGLFDTIWMSDVIEHFATPNVVLAKVSTQARKGALLFLHTSNGDSLTHKIYGKNWEGYSDYSHYGVDQVTAMNLRMWLDKFGWDLVHWECGKIWAEGVDPVLIRLKEIYEIVPEMKIFLEEMEFGDTIQLVARKR
jgi:2-polyprenyl-3-methyl-5-hydroxy-6-metoxy-1,4-benzoquinol methylase